MVYLMILLGGALGLATFYYGMINVRGFDDGVKGRYVNSLRGLAARVYDMGYFSAADRDDREDDNKARNEARVLSRLEK